MARRPSNRGGPRQGTPGASYSNRTDLAADRAPATPGGPSAASGGLPPAPVAPPPEAPPLTPDDITPLDAPTNRPNEPTTAGLPIGAGPGPTDQTRQDLAAMRQYLPFLSFLTTRPDTPASVVRFYNLLSSSTP